MKRLLIIGAGFAGMYAATSAARLRDLQGVSPNELEIALICARALRRDPAAAIRSQPGDDEGAA